MGTNVSLSLDGMFANMPQIFVIGLVGFLLMFAGYFLVKGYWRLRGNSAFHSYQMGVVAPEQYGARGPEPEADKFARRLEKMADKEEAYEMSKLLPQAREFGSIKEFTFHTAPVLAGDNVRVLGLIEAAVQESGGGFRVLVNASLKHMVDLEETHTRTQALRLSMVGIVLKFAVVDRFGRLVMAIDHLGDKPLTRQENINRTVVIEVLRKAGVWYLEIPPHYSAAHARAQILAVLGGKAAAQNRDEDVA